MELCIRDVSKTYANGVRALDSVSLTIAQGMYGLLGPNGAGKSTLMRILATLQEPDEGSVRFGDLDVLSQKNEVRKTLGYLPQEFGVFPMVSAENMLDHFALLKGISTSVPIRLTKRISPFSAPALGMRRGMAASNSSCGRLLV